MGRRIAWLSAAVLAVLLLATVVPTTFLPNASIGATGGERGKPTSTIEPLPAYTTSQVVTISFTAYKHGNGSSGGDGDDDDDDDGVSAFAGGSTGAGTVSGAEPAGGNKKLWVELFYRSPGTSDWILYKPPWNPDGRWFGQDTQRKDVVTGLIPFDTSYTGGEIPYSFTTVAEHRKHGREALDGAKANTTVDWHAPQLFIATPVPGEWTNRDVLRWAADDAVSGVATVSVALDGAEPRLFDTAEGETELFAIPGDHSALVRAMDRAGNRAEVAVPFRFDPDAPSLSVTAPARDAFVRTPDVDVTWSADDAGAGLASLLVTVDTSAPVALGPEVRSYALANLPERGHVVSLLATDGAGNLATQAVPFTVDATPPALSILAPSGPYVNTEDLQVLWVGTDSNSGIDRFELVLDGTVRVVVISGAGYTFENVAEGPHEVVVRAFDRAGNVESKTVHVTVDVTPPEVRITSPGAGETVYGSVQVAWNATDDGSDIAGLEFVFDAGDPVIVIGAPSITVGSPSLGPHFARIRATDHAGNMAEDGVPFTYGGVVPQGPLGISALDFGLLMLLLGAIAVVSAYFAIRRRRRRSGAP